MISIINNPDSTVAYFRMEDYDRLLQSGTQKRILEKTGVRKLLEKLGIGGEEPAYRESGQPYFKNRPELFLSISHAKGWFAVSVGTVPVGVDIQTTSSRLKQGQDYFRNEQEARFSADEKALHLIWGAKEAVYKLKEGKLKDLKEEVVFRSFTEDALVVECQSHPMTLGYRPIENGFLVFTR